MTLLIAAMQSLLVAATTSATLPRRVSFWYAPGSYGGGDINATLDLVRAHKNVVTSVFLYCGHSVGEAGAFVADSKTGLLCTSTGLISQLAALEVEPELCLNSGTSNVSDYRRMFANSTAVIADMVRIGKQWNAKGWSMDLEPQKGSPASTAADADSYAKFLLEARTALNSAGMRLTASSSHIAM